MDSIEKLRQYAPITSEWDAILNAAADEIEREISERYMELPLDADGVPIKVGETCYDINTGEPFEVSSVEWNDVCWSAWSKPETRHIAGFITHKKHRTIEDVLFDAVGDAEEGLISPNEIIARYAAELRGMGVGE